MIRNILANRSKLFVFNTATNLFTQFVALVVSIIVLPIKLNYFGPKIFGIFILVSSFQIYFQRVDFGIGITIQRYTANLLVRQKDNDIRRLLGFGFVFNCVYGLLIASVLLTAGYLSNNLFSLEPENVILFRQLIIVVAIRTIIVCPLSVFNTFLNGAQHFFFTNTINLINIFGDLFFVYWIVYTKSTIVNYLILASLLGISTSCISAIYAIAHFPFAKPARFKWKEIKGYFSFSFQMLKSQFSSIVQYETDRIIIGIFLGAQSVTYYHVGEKLHGTVRRVFNSFARSMTPLMSEKYAANDQTYLQRAIYDGSRMITILWYPIILVLIIGAKSIIEIWLGAEYVFLHTFASIFLAPYIINLPCIVLNQILIGSGHVKEFMNTRVIGGIFNLVVSIILVRYYGIWGVLIGTLCQYILFGIYYYRFYFNFVDIDVKKYIRKVIVPGISVGAATAASSIILKILWTPANMMELGIFLILPVLIGYLSAILKNRSDFTYIYRLIFSH